MSKFIIVKKAPVTLSKGELLIRQPDFLEQIREFSHRASKRKLTAIHHLRDVLNAVRLKYDQDMNLFKVPLALYEGLAFNSDEDLSKIVVSLLKKEHPAIFEKVLEHEIKSRPYGTKLIYYVGNISETGPFFRNGFDMIEEKDLDDFLSGKPKKVIGKPAVTNEQAEANKKLNQEEVT